MPLPFDMLAVMLFISYYTETVRDDPPSPLYAITVVLASALVMAALSAVVNRIAVRQFTRRDTFSGARRDVPAKAGAVVRIALVLVFMAALDESALPWSIARACSLPTHPESFTLQLFGLLPYIVLFFAAWFPMYTLHRVSTPGVWTRRSFILNKARYNLYILLAWIPFAFLADWLGEFIVLLPVIFLFAAWAFPVILARAWGCRRLEDPAAVQSVRRMEEKAGVRFSRVYLWEPGGGNVQNAAAVGFMQPFRYLFLTPALIRGMNGPELDAVILHELGHIKKKHLLFYLFTSLAGINAAVLLGLYLPLSPAERFVVTAGLILFYFRFVFGWLSRNMERQADLFALEKNGSAKGLVNALEKLGIAAGHIRLASSWHHLGIAERVEFLRRAERHPVLQAAHNQGVNHIMVCGYLLSAGVIACLSWLIYADYASESLPASFRPAALVQQEERSHWQRVLRLMPESAAVRLELAHSLAKSPEHRDDARSLAAEARRMAEPGEVRAAADKLLRDLTP